MREGTSPFAHRVYPGAHHSGLRQAHRRRDRRRGSIAMAVLGLAAVGTLTIGAVTMAQAGTADPPASPAASTAGHGTTIDPGAVAVRDELAVAPATPVPTSASSVVTAPLATSSPTTCPATSASAARLNVPRPVAAFLGDSYVTGYVGAGLGTDGWPARISAAFGWRELMKAVAGTGFVNPGWTSQPIGTQVSAVIRARPGIVVIAGGHNDDRYSPSAVATAADAVLKRLRSGLPDAVLVVIGPIWQDGSPPSSIRALDDHLRRTAAAIGALFIDPIRGGWFAGSAHRYIGPDGIHPTQAGETYLTSLMLSPLRARVQNATASPAGCGA
jgi:lysophospholipase L1-like esterase